MKKLVSVLVLFLASGAWGQIASAGYVHNDPINKVDPTGKFTEGLTEAHRQVFQHQDGTTDVAGTLPPEAIDVVATTIGAGADLLGGGVPSGEGLVVKELVATGLGGVAKKGAGETAEGAGRNAARGRPALKGDPYSPGEVSKRQSETRRQLDTGNIDPDSPIPDQSPGRNIKGAHSAKDKQGHDTGERNVNRHEEHSRVPKGNRH